MPIGSQCKSKLSLEFRDVSDRKASAISKGFVPINGLRSTLVPFGIEYPSTCVSVVVVRTRRGEVFAARIDSSMYASRYGIEVYKMDFADGCSPFDRSGKASSKTFRNFSCFSGLAIRNLTDQESKTALVSCPFPTSYFSYLSCNCSTGGVSSALTATRIMNNSS